MIIANLYQENIARGGWSPIALPWILPASWEVDRKIIPMWQMWRPGMKSQFLRSYGFKSTQSDSRIDHLESTMNLSFAGFVFSWEFMLAGSRRTFIPTLQEYILSVCQMVWSVFPHLSSRNLQSISSSALFLTLFMYLFSLYFCSNHILLLNHLLVSMFEACIYFVRILLQAISIFRINNWSFNLEFI